MAMVRATRNESCAVADRGGSARWWRRCAGHSCQARRGAVLAVWLSGPAGSGWTVISPSSGSRARASCELFSLMRATNARRRLAERVGAFLLQALGQGLIVDTLAPEFFDHRLRRCTSSSISSLWIYGSAPGRRRRPTGPSAAPCAAGRRRRHPRGSLSGRICRHEQGHPARPQRAGRRKDNRSGNSFAAIEQFAEPCMKKKWRGCLHRCLSLARQTA